MVDIKSYLCKLCLLLRQQYGERLVYVGLQGSYLRGEANRKSDIDIMVVIDDLSIADLNHYRLILQSIGHYELSCGFICSKTDLENWNPLEICNLLNSTKDYHGSLKELVPQYTQNDIKNFIKLSLNNLYHEICHRYIHSDRENNRRNLPGSYKAVFYIMQSIYYLSHGEYVSTKSELLKRLVGFDRTVLEQSIAIQTAETYDFDESFKVLFSWCQESLHSIC